MTPFSDTCVVFLFATAIAFFVSPITATTQNQFPCSLAYHPTQPHIHCTPDHDFTTVSSCAPQQVFLHSSSVSFFLAFRHPIRSPAVFDSSPEMIVNSLRELQSHTTYNHQWQPYIFCNSRVTLLTSHCNTAPRNRLIYRDRNRPPEDVREFLR